MVLLLLLLLLLPPTLPVGEGIGYRSVGGGPVNHKPFWVTLARAYDKSCLAQGGTELKDPEKLPTVTLEQVATFSVKVGQQHQDLLDQSMGLVEMGRKEGNSYCAHDGSVDN